MGRDSASESVPIALAEADQRTTSGRRHQRKLTPPPLPSRGARRQGPKRRHARRTWRAAIPAFLQFALIHVGRYRSGSGRW
jgi:hypothetical protein